jgi:lipopolysaccharide/colanic/teichoic acid biosynthesis glycosyltransferase
MIDVSVHNEIQDHERRTNTDDLEALDFNLYATIKVFVETALAVILLVVLAPLLGVLMVLVKLTSRGPALYTQERLGRHGRSYTIYKLRTMFDNCERWSGAIWSPENDPRVTPLGHWLRRLHLDELPQLWNVARGEMSLIGPRPERPVFVRQLERAIPEYRQRLQVRPGITGLAQIQLPPDSEVSAVRRKVQYDLYYIHQLGPWLDLRILLGTVLKVLGVPFSVIRWVLGLPTEGEAEAVPRSAAVAALVPNSTEMTRHFQTLCQQ